ncbi:DUF2956 family protein [Ferrimonas senticii]|uniref:DUF2956 family protein n=1 Tax=Ferrimonas senticii TaxID=394566 RepID=UPI0003F66AD8|nr:DUF2956 family protein [Ferrimonas senticii]
MSQSQTAKAATNKPSEQVVAEAMKIARATQVAGQTKEQTKLIAKDIQHGIEQYKKQQKAKARAADKAKKQQLRSKAAATTEPVAAAATTTNPARLPWLLLALSWLGFAVAGYLFH